MGIFVDAFNTILYQPLFNALVIFYEYLPGHDFGVAVIALTLLIKFILYPLGNKGIQSQKSLQGIQPKIKEIQEKFKNDKERQAREMLELYKREKINPFSGFAVLLVQLPILLALYRLFWKGFAESQLQFLYSFIPHPGTINTTFLGIMDLAKASVFLALLTGVAQFFQTKMITPVSTKAPAGKPDFSGTMQKQMLYFFPVFTVFILWRMPSAIALYWLVTTLFTIGQQYITLKKTKKNDAGQPPKN